MTINNVAPTATFNAPASVNEGSPIGLSLTSPSDPSSVDTTAGFTYAFDCGSGFGAFSAASTAELSDERQRQPHSQGQIKDKDGGVNEYTASVTINNVAPTRDLQRSRLGQRGLARSASRSPRPSDPRRWTPPPASPTRSTAARASAPSARRARRAVRRATTAARTVKGQIKDKDGGSNQYTASVTIDKSAPSIAISGAANVNEGSAYSLTLGAVTDPGTDTVTSYVVHWGDGNSDTYGANGAKTHTYADGAGDRAITVDLVDEDGTFLDRANAHVGARSTTSRRRSRSAARRA